MELLTQIFHKPNLQINSKTITREAVRAIILRGDQVLMVHSLVNGDYKFPGGGVEDGEEHTATLRRELLEECGAQLKNVLNEFGRVEEYDKAKEDEYELFCMHSYYYLCEIEASLGSQDLEEYESAYGFTPEWVTPEHAIAVNRALLENPPTSIQRWVKRELFVLEQIRKRLQK